MPNENNKSGSLLIDYFAFNYLPDSLIFFKKQTRNKLIFLGTDLHEPYYLNQNLLI